MFSQLQFVLFGFAVIYVVYLQYFKVSIHVNNIKHQHHLKSFPSTWSSIIPVLFNQLVCKYGYVSYLFKTEWGKSKILPTIITTIGPFSIDLNHLHQYMKCVGIKDTNSIPFGYFHCLCVKLLLFTLGKRQEFPLKLLGSVHYKNTFKIYKCIFNKNSKLFIKTSVNKQIYFTQKHDLTFSVSHQIFVINNSNDKELIVEITDLYLIRAPKKHRKKTDGSEKEDYFKIDNIGDIVDNEYKWDYIKSNKSFNYSIICGDINPIHIHKYLAKLFGFKSNIAHGMWSVAKIMHKLLDNNDVKNYEEIIVETTFERPLFLPNKPMLKVLKDANDNQARFKLFDDKNKVILQGYLVKS
eukprot:244002_1